MILFICSYVSTAGEYITHRKNTLVSEYAFFYFDRHVMDVRRLTDIIENRRLPSISVGVIWILDNLTVTAFLFASAVEMFLESVVIAGSAESDSCFYFTPIFKDFR